MVLDVQRERLTFPKLNARAISLARDWRADVMLIEDAASGQQLLQTLWAEAPPGIPVPIPRRPEGDKVSRVMAANDMIEAGRLVLPGTGAWLGAFTSELLAFPNGKHDDLVDALTQLLIWARRYEHPSPILAMPELIDICDSDRDRDWPGEIDFEAPAWIDDLEDLASTY